MSISYKRTPSLLVYKTIPVIAADISEWDVRGATITRQGDKLVRYMLRGVESAARRVRLAQANGLNVTQW